MDKVDWIKKYRKIMDAYVRYTNSGNQYPNIDYKLKEMLHTIRNKPLTELQEIEVRLNSAILALRDLRRQEKDLRSQIKKLQDKKFTLQPKLRSIPAQALEPSKLPKFF